MEEERVRPLRNEPRPPRDHRVVRLIGLVVTAVALAVGFWAAGRGSPDPAAERVAVTPSAETVRAFFGYVGEGNIEAATRLLAADRSYVLLPGLSDVIAPETAAGPALGFLAEVAAVEVGECDDPKAVRRDPTASVVRCSVVVVSDYRTDLDLADGSGTVTAVVSGGVLRSVLASIDDRGASFEQYCLWARDADPAAAAAAFDDRCRPVETADTAHVHLRLAAAYGAESVEPGEPSPLAVVDAFARIHNAGGAPIALFDEPFRVVTVPGVPIDSPRWPYPELEDYLAWSSAVYDFELGRCFAEPRSGLTAVRCDGAVLTGPLPLGLGIGPVEAPVQFFVRDGLIVGISGRSPEPLIRAFADLCTLSGSNAAFLGSGCVPRYDADSAVALLAALG